MADSGGFFEKNSHFRRSWAPVGGEGIRARQSRVNGPREFRGGGFVSIQCFVSAKNMIFFVISPWLQGICELAILWTLHTRLGAWAMSPQRMESRRVGFPVQAALCPAVDGRSLPPARPFSPKDGCPLFRPSPNLIDAPWVARPESSTGRGATSLSHQPRPSRTQGVPPLFVDPRLRQQALRLQAKIPGLKVFFGCNPSPAKLLLDHHFA
jgi:hypothetical protein